MAEGADLDLSISITDGSEVELSVKGSRFLGQACRADDEEAGRARLDSIRKRYHDATHHCWALRTGDPDRPLERWDDDGEPSGTAGLPIIGEIRRAGLNGLLVVVVRWFGGTKLGTGGLARAYGQSARAALEEAGRREVWRLETLDLEVSFDQLGVVEGLLGKQGPSVHAIHRDFAEGPHFRVAVRCSRADGLRAALIEATRGRIRFGGEAGE